MKLHRQLEERGLVVLLGAGGVGKTTVSAACALEAARRGRSTLVLTIDPAKRLADALGISMGSEVVHVGPNLDALMLDTKKALDDLMTRYAPDQATLDRILSSRFYTQLSDAFAGSEEFVAMGSLYEILAEGDYDLVVVDTPPSKHALDFLDAPRRLIRVYDSSLVRYVFKPTRLLRLGGGYLAKSFSRWTSLSYLDEVTDFLSIFDEMFMDLETRVRAMQEVLLDRRRTSVDLVTGAEAEAVPVTLGLHHEVTGPLGLQVETLVVNRYLPRLPGMDALEALEDAGDPTGAVADAVAEAMGAPAEDAAAFVADALAAARFYDLQAREHAATIEALQGALEAEVRRVPAFRQSVHDLEGLERLRAVLFPEASARTRSS